MDLGVGFDNFPLLHVLISPHMARHAQNEIDMHRMRETDINRRIWTEWERYEQNKKGMNRMR